MDVPTIRGYTARKQRLNKRGLSPFLVMKVATIGRIALLVTIFLVALALLFHFVYRPWQLTWGATAAEVARPMPGDELVDSPSFNATRAVTVNAPAERIWPWIVQMGYKRAGFYSWDVLDNDGIPSSERILPEYQDLEVGDWMPLSDDADAEVVALEPNRQLLLVFQSDGAATWAWGLYEIDAERTRLVSRLRWRAPNRLSQFTLDAFEIIMMRKCLLGIKHRAEDTAKVAAEVAVAAHVMVPLDKRRARRSEASNRPARVKQGQAL